jgi:hypothetical protein
MHNCMHWTITSVHSHGEGEYDRNGLHTNTLLAFVLAFAGEQVIGEVRAREGEGEEGVSVMI